MIAAMLVSGAMPIYMVANSVTKKRSGIPSMLMAFSMMIAITGNRINWISISLFLKVSFICFFKIANIFVILN